MATSGLSNAFVFSTRPTAAPAAAVEMTVPPYNKDTFARGGQKILFNIPSGKRGQYLNTRQSFLQFQMRVTQPAVGFPSNAGSTYMPILSLDGGAHALFRSLQVYHGSNLIEHIDQYNVLHTLLTDQGCSSADYGRSVAEGYADGDMKTLPGNYRHRYDDRGGKIVSPIKLDPTQSTVTYGLVDVTNNTGNDELAIQLLNAGDDTNTISVSKSETTVTHTFCIPLASGVLGAQMSKYLPIGALAADIRLELELEDFDQAMVTNRILKITKAEEGSDDSVALVVDKESADFQITQALMPKVELSNFDLKLEVVEVDSDVQSAIEAANGGEYMMSYDSWSNFQNTIKAETQAVTQLLGTKFSSIKDLATIYRPQAHQMDIRYRGLTSRVDPYSNNLPIRNDSNIVHYNAPYNTGDGWYYLIGATHYPPRPVSTNEQAYYEALKSMHVLSSADQPGRINFGNWSVSARVMDNTATTASGVAKKLSKVGLEGGTYYASQNLESQAHKSGIADAGINTLSQTVYMVMRMPPSYGSSSTASLGRIHNPDLRIDTFAHYDVILAIRNGMMHARF